MVEHFNGRISKLLQQTRFDSRADLETTLLNYAGSRTQGMAAAEARIIR